MSISRRNFLLLTGVSSVALFLSESAESEPFIAENVNVAPWVLGFLTGVPANTKNGEYDPLHNAHVEFLESWRQRRNLPKPEGEITWPSQNTDKSDCLTHFGIYVMFSGMTANQAAHKVRQCENDSLEFGQLKHGTFRYHFASGNIYS